MIFFGLFIRCKQNTSENTKELKEKAVKLQKEALKYFGVIPSKMPGSKNDTPELVSLGRRLFFEKRLSENNTISCNSCHRIDKNLAGVDNLPTSPGTKGKTGTRNSPTVYNAGFHITQFWDGRAKDLVEQAKEPILNSIKMGIPNKKVVVKKISRIRGYRKLFKKVFPKTKRPISYNNIAIAIAAFERTLITTDRFDDFQKGSLDVLTKDELIGLDKFIKIGCVTCHNGPLLGGNSYNKIGLLNVYENNKDFGRFNETKNEIDKFMFKVPSLRNVALTAPYFHDGKIKTLEKAVETITYLQLNKKLNKMDVGYIVKFLMTLSGKNFTLKQEKKTKN
ncbi:cytochrome-c peroxidase [Candidatus Uabimicrobium sp. HlEnr_7]|uniref:cytochrome-c peroxidase n=1 Tax=Candidatus Uabimicrobium helgolandensis TaxID=3095367 RepID=UPI003556FC95